MSVDLHALIPLIALSFLLAGFVKGVEVDGHAGSSLSRHALIPLIALSFLLAGFVKGVEVDGHAGSSLSRAGANGRWRPVSLVVDRQCFIRR